MSKLTNNAQELDSSEQQRVDALLSAARSAHYVSFLLAAITMACAYAPMTKSLHVPVLELNLPRPQAAIALYVLTIILVAVADKMFRSAFEWMPFDTRRPPFAWISLSTNYPSYLLVTLWLAAPIVITASALTPLLGTSPDRVLLIWIGVGVAAMPRLVDNYLSLIRQREDHRGGPATLSIWLLYWYRVVRQSLGAIALLSLVLAAVPEWRHFFLHVAGYTAVAVFCLMIIRSLGGWQHRRIDRIGPRFGFDRTNVHDYAEVNVEPPGTDA